MTRFGIENGRSIGCNLSITINYDMDVLCPVCGSSLIWLGLRSISFLRQFSPLTVNIRVFGHASELNVILVGALVSTAYIPQKSPQTVSRFSARVNMLWLCVINNTTYKHRCSFKVSLFFPHMY